MMTNIDVAPAPAPIPGERTLLIVEDDKSFLTRLARAMEQRGFAVSTAETVADGLLQVEKAPPFYAVVDMRLGDGNGLDVISALKKRRPEAHGVVLTGYGNIATAVNAVKLGAIDYLAKPADADDVETRCSRSRAARPSRRKIRCRRTACAGSISSGYMSCAIATSRRRRGASTCIAAPCSVSWRSAHRSDARLARPCADLIRASINRDSSENDGLPGQARQ